MKRYHIIAYYKEYSFSESGEIEEFWEPMDFENLEDALKEAEASIKENEVVYMIDVVRKEDERIVKRFERTFDFKVFDEDQIHQKKAKQ